MVDEINDRREESIVSVVGGRVCEEPPISRGSRSKVSYYKMLECLQMMNLPGVLSARHTIQAATLNLVAIDEK